MPHLPWFVWLLLGGFALVMVGSAAAIALCMAARHADDTLIRFREAWASPIPPTDTALDL